MDELDISYALAKKVPDMRRGFRIETRYGEIEVDAGDAAPFADLMVKLLERNLKQSRTDLTDEEVREVFGSVFGRMK